MGLDVSGAKSLACDLQRTSDAYRTHDPDLAEEISVRAHDICREFGIDPELLNQSLTTSEHTEVVEPDAHAKEPTSIRDDQSMYRDEASDIQLQSILDRQREMTDDVIVSSRKVNAPRRRSTSTTLGNLLHFRTN